MTKDEARALVDGLGLPQAQADAARRTIRRATSSENLDIIKEAGFANITLQKEKNITIPDDILANYLSPAEKKQYKESNINIQSITVYADKPAKDERNCCEPGNGCC